MDRYPTGLLQQLGDAPPDAHVVITSALENDPELLQALEFERPLFGSSVEAIRLVRDPQAFLSLPKQHGLRIPAIKSATGAVQRLKQRMLRATSRQRFLVKPRRSAGGLGIDWWRSDMAVGAEHYTQQYIPGKSVSAVYRADGWAAQLVGATEQLVGESLFGARGFQYCGSIGPWPLSEQAREALANLGVVLSQQYDLRGIFGVDLVMDDRGRLWPVEINPRYPASTEIVEQMTGISTLQSMREHRQQRGKRGQPGRQRAYGKALLFARQPSTIPDLYAVLPEHAVADVPETGRVVEAGQPICTVFAAEATHESCEQTLQKRASAVYDALAPA